jgi:hypothetical protein
MGHDDCIRPRAHDETTSGFTGIGDQNQLNPMFARAGEATDFPLNMLPPGESLPETPIRWCTTRPCSTATRG